MATSSAGYSVTVSPALRVVRFRLASGSTCEAPCAHAVPFSLPPPVLPHPHGTRGLWSASLLVRSGDKMNGVQCPGRLGAACRSVHRRLCTDPGRVGLRLLTCHLVAQKSWIPRTAPSCRWTGRCRSGPSCHTPGQTGGRKHRCFCF